MNIDFKKVTDIVIANVDHSDYPDYCDAYIESASYEGRELATEEVEELSEMDEARYYVNERCGEMFGGG